MTWSSRLVVCTVLLACTADVRAQRGRPNLTTVMKNATDQALNDPGFDAPTPGGVLNGYQQALQDAKDLGLQGADLDAFEKQLQDAMKNGKELGKQSGQNQNPSGTADWWMGSVIPGVDYHVNFPLTNDCKVGTKVTIQYPESIPLTGPPDVTLPPKSTVEAKMTLSFNRDNPPQGNWQNGPLGPNGFIGMLQMADALTVTHPSGPAGTKVTPAGTYTYVCNKMQRTYSIALTLLWAPPTSDVNDKPQGGYPKPQPKKKTGNPYSSSCSGLFSQGVFVPDSTHASPGACQSEVSGQLSDLIDSLAPLKAHSPKEWSFLPDKRQLDHMSVEDMLVVRHKAVQLMVQHDGGK